MIYLRADRDLEEQCRNANAPPWRIWRLRFGLSAKPKHFEMQAGRACSSGSWQPSACQTVPQPRVKETPSGSEPVLHLLKGQQLNYRPGTCAHPLAWYCPQLCQPGTSGLTVRALQRSLPGAFQPPLPWSCFTVSAGFWTLKSLLEQRLQLCFSENSSVFLLYNPALCITYPPVPLPDKLILPFPFFNRKTGA